MGKESFIIYKSFYEPVKSLSDKQLGRLFRALFDYQINQSTHVDADIQMAFAFFKNQMDIDNGKYQKIVERNKRNGLNGGRPIIEENPKNPVGLKKPKKADNDNENDNENDINSAHEEFSINPVITNSNLFRKPIIPKYEEVERVFIQQGGTVEMAKKFFAKYEATEWFYNNSPIMKFTTLVPGFMEIWRRNSNRQPEVAERKRFKL